MGVFRKEYFWGYDEIVDIFLGSSQVFFVFFLAGGGGGWGGGGHLYYIYTF